MSEENIVNHDMEETIEAATASAPPEKTDKKKRGPRKKKEDTANGEQATKDACEEPAAKPEKKKRASRKKKAEDPGFAVKTPEDVAGEEGSVTVGGWIPDPDGDGCIAVYVSDFPKSVVIGHYDSFKDKTEECDTAVSLDKLSGKIVLQSHGEDGEIRFADVPPEVLHTHLKSFLDDLAVAVGAKSA